MNLSQMQLIQLKAYTDAVVELDRFTRSTPEPAPGPGRTAYWSQRADIEEHKRNMFNAFNSSLRWGNDA